MSNVMAFLGLKYLTQSQLAEESSRHLYKYFRAYKKFFPLLKVRERLNMVSLSEELITYKTNISFKVTALDTRFLFSCIFAENFLSN